MRKLLYLRVEVPQEADTERLGHVGYEVDVLSPGSARHARPKFGPYHADVLKLPRWLAWLVGRFGS